MAYHWSRPGCPSVAHPRRRRHPAVFSSFLGRHGIAPPPCRSSAPGRRPRSTSHPADRQPHMDHFVEGVWAGSACTRPRSEWWPTPAACTWCWSWAPVARGAPAGRRRPARATWTVVRRLPELPALDGRAVRGAHGPLDVGRHRLAGRRSTTRARRACGAVAFARRRLVVVTLGRAACSCSTAGPGRRRLRARQARSPVAGTTGRAAATRSSPRSWRPVGDEPRPRAASTAGAAPARCHAWPRPLPDEAQRPGVRRFDGLMVRRGGALAI